MAVGSDTPVLREYMQHLRRKGYSDRTRETYLWVIRQYMACVNPLTATAAQIEGWLDSHRLAAKTRYGYVGAIAGFHEWLVQTDRIEHDVTVQLVRPKCPRRYPRPIPTDDLARAVAAAPPRMRLWLSLAAYAGLRCMEIAYLQAEDIRRDLNPQVFHLKATKGGKDRIVPIADEILEALDRHGVPLSGWVTPAINCKGESLRRPVRPNYISNRGSKYLRDMEIPASMHQLRHWFGTEMYRRTRDLKLVAELMGHAKIETTSLYVALVPTEEAVEAVRSLKAIPAGAEVKGELQSPDADQESNDTSYWDGEKWATVSGGDNEARLPWPLASTAS